MERNGGGRDSFRGDFGNVCLSNIPRWYFGSFFLKTERFLYEKYVNDNNMWDTSLYLLVCQPVV
jgi:hypothetical protein